MSVSRADALATLAIADDEVADLDQFQRAEILRELAALNAQITRRVRQMTVIARDQDGMTWGTLASTLTGDVHARSTARSTYDAGIRQINERPVKHTADIVVLREDGHVLVIRRRWQPFKGMWALPGGHVDAGELPVDAAARELLEETGVNLPAREFKHLGVWNAPGRDPRGPYSTTAYVVHVPADTEAVAGSDAAEAQWLPISECRGLAFDHDDIVAAAV
jgi:8-oxo-dGTP diphosphatase